MELQCDFDVEREITAPSHEVLRAHPLEGILCRPAKRIRLQDVIHKLRWPASPSAREAVMLARMRVDRPRWFAVDVIRARRV
jgi:hypothetical protein